MQAFGFPRPQETDLLQCQGIPERSLGLKLAKRWETGCCLVQRHSRKVDRNPLLDGTKAFSPFLLTWGVNPSSEVNKKSEGKSPSFVRCCIMSDRVPGSTRRVNH